MHQIRFRPGLCPGPRWGAYSAPPDLLAGLRGPTSNGRGGKGTGKEERGGRGRGKGLTGNGEMGGKGRDAWEKRKGEGKGGKSRGAGRGGKKSKNTPPSIPAYAPAPTILYT